MMRRSTGHNRQCDMTDSEHPSRRPLETSEVDKVIFTLESYHNTSPSLHHHFTITSLVCLFIYAFWPAQPSAPIAAAH